MKKGMILLALCMVSSPLMAYEQSMPNLAVPTGLESGEGEFRVQHRFYGKVFDDPFDDPLESPFGTNEGVNVDLGIRYQIWANAEVNLAYGTDLREVVLGGSYALPVPGIPLRGQIDFQILSFEPSLAADRENNFYGQISLQAGPFLKRIAPVVNFGYDGYAEKTGLGLGLSVVVFRKLELAGEYFPLFYEEEVDERDDCFALGLKINTSGHHFVILFGNGVEIGSRHLMRGAFDRDLRMGFAIHRILEL